jgi:hypothetical protein
MELEEMARKIQSGMAKMAPQLKELGVIFGEISVQFGEFAHVLATFTHAESKVATCKYAGCPFASLPYREFCYFHDDYTKQPTFYVFTTEELLAKYLQAMLSINVYPSVEELEDTEVPYPAAGGWPLVFEDSLPESWVREMSQWEGGDTLMCEEKKDVVEAEEEAREATEGLPLEEVPQTDLPASEEEEIETAEEVVEKVEGDEEEGTEEGAEEEEE